MKTTGKKPTNIVTRFMRLLKITPTCWLWQGTKRRGYGSICTKRGSPVLAHRLAWYMFVGDIPNGLLVLHRCDIRNCVNPEHLFLGTQEDNQQDCLVKGRNFHASKTRCKNGHEFTQENTYVGSRGRYCRACRREVDKRRSNTETRRTQKREGYKRWYYRYKA